MENFIVSARKYRPATFDTVVGQLSLTTTLKNAIRSNHLAQAYLFCGPRGVGKTTCARIFAKTINCFQVTAEMEACGQCESCKSFTESRSYNIHELDAASNNSVDDIRNLIDQVRIPPQVGKYSIYIIDEVHMLSTAAFNAFLKTLEEPPKHAVFILATTEKHKIIPTILSRCQIFDFNRIQIDDTVQFLEKISKSEGNQYEQDALNIIAQKADGAMRDALSIYDQIVSFSGGNISYKSVIDNLNILDYDYYFRLVDAFLASKIGDSLLLFDEILNDGFDAQNFINGLGKHFRDLMVCKDVATIQLLEVGNNIKEKYKQQSAQCGIDFLFEGLNIISNCDIHFKSSRNQRLHVELAMLNLSLILEKKKKLDESVKQASTQQKPTAAVPAQQAPAPTATANKTVAQAPQATAIETVKKTMPSTPSLKNIFNKPQQNDTPQAVPASEDINNDSQIEEQQTKDHKSFTESQLTTFYAQFVETLKQERPRMYSSLVALHPELQAPHTIIIKLSNDNQADDFNKTVRSELIRHLRAELQNSDITIETIVEEQTEQNRLYTPEEKFKHMAEKNPTLNKLKQQWGLDFG